MSKRFNVPWEFISRENRYPCLCYQYSLKCSNTFEAGKALKSHRKLEAPKKLKKLENISETRKHNLKFAETGKIGKKTHSKGRYSLRKLGNGPPITPLSIHIINEQT